MATIQSTLSLQDKMSPAFAAITKAMDSTLSAVRSIKGIELGPEFAQAAADIKLAENAVNRMNQELTQTTASSDSVTQLEQSINALTARLTENNATTSQLLQSESALNEQMNTTSATANIVSDSISKTEGAMRKAENAANIAATQTENYQRKLENLSAEMDSGAESIQRLEQLQKQTYSASRQSEIEKFIKKQDKLAETYQKTEIALLKSNAAYDAQKNKLNTINQELGKTEKATKKVKDTAVENPFAHWSQAIMGVYHSLRLASRMINFFKKGLLSVLEKTGQWEGILKTANTRIDTIKGSIGEALLPLVTVIMNTVIPVFDFFAEKINSATLWINENIDLITTGLAILGTIIMAVATIWLINWTLAHIPLLLIISGITAIIIALNSMGIDAEQILEFVGGLFGSLYAIIYDGIAYVWNYGIAPFAEFLANVFDDPIGSIVRLFASMADSVLAIMELIAKGIDKLFGSNLASSVSGWRSSLAGLVEEKYGTAAISVARMDYMTLGQGWEKGAEIGKSIGTGLTNMGDALKEFDLSKYSTSTSGGSALRTTGEVELSADDIKMLLDIATRQYAEVTYQQITPEIVLQGVVVHESADMDVVMDVVAERVYEIANADLMVAVR